MRKWPALCLAACLLPLAPTVLRAELKDYVLLIKPLAVRKEAQDQQKYDAWFPRRSRGKALATQPAQEPAPEAQERGGGAGQETKVGLSSVVGSVGTTGLAFYYGVAYTGMIFPAFRLGQTPMQLGLSAVVGGADDGSFFVLGGTALAFFTDLIFPVRIGIASTPLGTSFIGNFGVLFKLDVLAVSVDFGYVTPGDFLVGAGLGINF